VVVSAAATATEEATGSAAAGVLFKGLIEGEGWSFAIPMIDLNDESGSSGVVETGDGNGDESMAGDADPVSVEVEVVVVSIIFWA
jgi:hypothetical protein